MHQVLLPGLQRNFQVVAISKWVLKVFSEMETHVLIWMLVVRSVTLKDIYQIFAALCEIKELVKYAPGKINRNAI